MNIGDLLLSDSNSIRILLSNGLDPNGLLPDGLTFLEMIAMFGAEDQISSYINAKYLLQSGADPNFHRSKNGTYHSAIQEAASNSSVQLLQLLLDNGGNPNDLWVEDGTIKSTPLIVASKYGRADNVEMLLKYGADPNIRDASNQLALDYAYRQENLLDDDDPIMATVDFDKVIDLLGGYKKQKQLKRKL